MRSHSIWRIGLLVSVLAVAPVAISCAGAANAPAPQRPGAGVVTGDPTGGDERPGGGDGSALAALDTAYIVRTGTLSVEVTDLQATLNQAQALITGLGGYISGSEEAHDTAYSYASITYRMPVERWFDALNGLRGLGSRVIAENTEAADVTAQVVDLDARLANLRAAETQYVGILARAATIDDVLKVQKVINETRGEIEQLQAQRDNLANRAALATLTVSWQVPTAASSAAREGWDFGREVDRAFTALVLMTQGLATLAIWLAIAIVPIVVPLALVVFIGYRLFRMRQRRVTMRAGTNVSG